MWKNKKIIFLGTPLFGANILRELLSMGYRPILVICQPDSQKDRKGRIILSPVKKLALEYQLPIIQPEKIGTSFEKIKALKPDLMLTAAYGQFVPNKILELFPDGAWNVHGSLLPKLRGGAPIHWAIINGEKITGVSLMRMVMKMDAGGVIAKESVTIDDQETYGSLLNKLLTSSRQLIRNHFEKLFSRQFVEESQNLDQVTFGHNITKHDQYLIWSKSMTKLDRQIRGLNPIPLAKTIFEETEIKVHQAIPTKIIDDGSPGEIIKIDRDGIDVVCGDQKVLRITKIQLPNKRAMTIQELINGRILLKKGMKFSNGYQK